MSVEDVVIEVHDDGAVVAVHEAYVSGQGDMGRQVSGRVRATVRLEFIGEPMNVGGFDGLDRGRLAQQFAGVARLANETAAQRLYEASVVVVPR